MAGERRASTGRPTGDARIGSEAGTARALDPGMPRARLGIDIGGTKAALAVAGPDGELRSHARFDDWSHGRWTEALDALIERSHGLLREAGIEAGELGGVGISAPGPLDIRKGLIVDAHNIPGWVDVPVVQHLEAAFKVPVVLENDANASAVAEWTYGAGRGTRNMLFLTMSSGVGAGLILDGQLYRGTTAQAGEVGHMPIELDGRACTCGLRGCFEAYTSGHAIARIIREEIEAGARTRLLDMAEGDPGRIDARLWVEAIREEDRYAQELRERYLDRLAQGLAGLIAAFDPERIVLGTMVQQNPDLFLEPLTPRVRERTWPAYHHVEIVAGTLGRELPFYAGLCASLLSGPQASGSR